MPPRAKKDESPAPAPAGAGLAPAPSLAGAGLGRLAYEAYRTAVGGASVGGVRLPTWDEQVKDKPDVAAAWCAAAQAAIAATWEKGKGHARQ